MLTGGAGPDSPRQPGRHAATPPSGCQLNMNIMRNASFRFNMQPQHAGCQDMLAGPALEACADISLHPSAAVNSRHAPPCLTPRFCAILVAKTCMLPPHFTEPVRRFLADGISGMGPNTFLAQTKRADAVATADLQEVAARAGDFEQPSKRRAGRDRRLFSDGISGMGLNTFLAQTKRAAAVTTADLQEVSAHAGDFQKPVKSRPEWGRRLRRLLLWQTCFDDC